MLYGMNIHHSALYLRMELRWIALLLWNSTIPKEALRRYAELLKEILAVELQLVLGTETTFYTTVGHLLHDPSAGDSVRMSLADVKNYLLKFNQVMTGKMLFFLGRPEEIESTMKGLLNCT